MNFAQSNLGSKIRQSITSLNTLDTFNSLIPSTCTQSVSK